MAMMTVKPLPGRQTARLTVLLALLTAASTVFVSAPASADTVSGAHRSDNVIRYVALGDSYAFGVGADHETESYPALLDAVAGVALTANRTTPGASTSNPAAGTIDVDEQIASALNQLRLADLVTLTVGGNDIKAIETLGACFTTPPECAAALSAIGQRLDSAAFVESLTATISSITTAAPNATVVVTGYPRLLDRSVSETVIPIPKNVVRTINELTDELNRVIKHAVHRADGRAIYVDVTKEFRDHSLGTTQSWLTLGGPASFHPNGSGYRFGYFAAITQAVDLQALRQQCGQHHSYQDQDAA
jgi:lysophospholipase L1-like esterase